MSTSCNIHPFLTDDSNQDSATTTAHSKCFIELLKEQKLLTSTLSKIWKILMVVQSNIDVLQNYTLCQFFPMSLNYNLSRYK